MESFIFDKLAEVEHRHWWFLARRQVLIELLHRLLDGRRDSLVIDVGCGTGGNTAAISDHFRCMGIDPAPEGITAARQRFPHCSFVQGFAPADISSAMRQAAAILLNDVIEHIEHDRAFLADQINALSPGSHIIITVPADPALWSQHDVDAHHFRRYTRESLREVWRGLPVDERLITSFNTHLYPVVKLVRAVSRHRRHAQGRSTDLWLPHPWINEPLRRIMASERRRIIAELQGRKRASRRPGVSLLAILRVRPGSQPEEGAQTESGSTTPVQMS